jgi:hypothetical protein
MRSLAALALLAVLLPAAPLSAQTATLPLPAPPVATNAAASAIFDAMLAISRAVNANPAAAQAASFPYAAAIGRYQAGDLAGAQRDALQAWSLAGQTPFPPASPAPLQPANPATRVTIPPLLDPPQADAEAFLAVTRRALATCAVTEKTQRAQLQTRYENAVHEYGAGRYNDVRADARAVIDACATPR